MASLKSKRIYQILLALLGGAFALSLILALTVAALIFSLEKKRLDITECFTSSWHQVSVCSQNPHYISVRSVPEHLRWSVLLSEDASFYQHSGFDWFEIQKSIDANLEKGAYVRGGSTITQQLAKNIYLSGEKSILRKLKEAYLTRQLEQTFNKNQILQAYLNVVELGDGLFGFGAAAQHYFQKEISQISPTQSAFLASLLPSPRRYQAHLSETGTVHPGQMERVRRIVNLLIQHGKIEESYRQVLADRESFNFWQSFLFWPSDEALKRPLFDIQEADFFETEREDFEDLSQKLPTNALDSPVGEEHTQKQEDPQVY